MRPTSTSLPRLLGLGATLGLLAGCYDPHPQAGAPCEVDTDCPAEYRCAQQRCLAGADPSDAGTTGSDASGLSAAALTGVRWNLPCKTAPANGFCTAAALQQSVTLPGAAPTLLMVTLRVRGVVEGCVYANGVPGSAAGWYLGGKADDPVDAGKNVFSLVVSDPPATYYANAVTGAVSTVQAFDYTVTVPMRAGATVDFKADPVDASALENKGGGGTPISIPGVTQPAQPYVGQFLRVDVLSPL